MRLSPAAMMRPPRSAPPPSQVVMTPHNAGETDFQHWDVTAQVVDNLQRFLASEPLRNRVDWSRGY